MTSAIKSRSTPLFPVFHFDASITSKNVPGGKMKRLDFSSPNRRNMARHAPFMTVTANFEVGTIWQV